MSKQTVSLVWVLALVTCASAARAQQAAGDKQSRPRGSGFNAASGLLGLLRNEAVRKDIELLDEQSEAIEKFAGEFRGAPSLPQFQQTTEDEREKLMRQLRAQMQERNKKMREKLAEVLLPHQLERLDQINVQMQGVQALTDPDVAAKLKLSDEQRQQIEAALQENRDSMGLKLRALFQKGNREEARKEFANLREERDEKVLSTLTPGQKQQFEALKGKPLDLPQGRSPRRTPIPGRSR